MAIKYLGLAVRLLAASLLFYNFSCAKKCTETTYSFNLPVKAYPDRDSINIGDTLWLEVNQSVILKNNDGIMIDYGGAANLGSVIDFQKIDTVNKIFIEAANKFEYKLEKGKELQRTSLYIEYNFAEANQSYVFKLAIVPGEKGIYRIGVGSSNNTYRKSDKCTKANFLINFKETISHDYYIRLVNPSAPINIPVTNNYFFKVK